MWAPNISIDHPGTANIIISVDRSKRTEEEFALNTDKGIKKTMFKVQNLGKGTLQTGDYNFVWVHYRIRSKKPSGEVEQMVYYLSRRENMYMIVCTSQNGQLDLLKPKIDTLLSNFKAL
ncbi:hypothetical protein EGI32_16585 [Ferruginibacter sp. HRS2-29]|nr:hypothetical protein [Ferruginibacter sp. HRS2-29]